MAIAVLFSLTVVSAGFATLRTLGLARGPLALGLAPGAGLASLTIVSTWLVLLGAPPPVPGLAVLGLTLAGPGLALADGRSVGRAPWGIVGERQLSAALLLVGVLLPLVVMGVAFAGVQVPLSPHDGAAHTEAIQAFRLGQLKSDWYPPGLAALFAAWLQLVPWLDSAQGAFDLGASLPFLAAVAVFGLSNAVWRDLRMASASAVLLGLTYLFPYFPAIWSGWPLAMSLVLVITTWTISLEYLKYPSLRWGALAGLVLGAIVLVHGTEVYTLALLLTVTLLGAWKRIVWPPLVRDAAIAASLGLGCAAVYLPTLVGWAGAGGAYSAGLVDEQALSTATLGAGRDTLVVFALDTLGIDLPLRVALLVVGIGWAWRKRNGRSVVSVGVLFVVSAALFSLLSGIPLVHQVYAITFPWGMHYRLFTIVAVAQVLLAGAGSVVAVRWLEQATHRPAVWARQLRRASRLLILAWLGLSTWAMAVFLAYPAGLVVGYTTDDAAAMAWLRQHVSPGQVMLNDGYADAGIWAPYKAGVPILLSRWEPLAADELRKRTLVLDNVGHLEDSPEAAAEACAHHVTYVYRGAAASSWDARRFPGLDALRASSALHEVFQQAGAVIFQVGLPCTW